MPVKGVQRVLVVSRTKGRLSSPNLGLKKQRSGSAMVEAALVMPIVILIVAGLISIGVELYERVRESSLSGREETLEYIEGNSLRAEDYMRIRRAAK